jgi:hypothetical protein
LPVCEICGMEVLEVHVCVECKTEYCDECGDIKAKLCYDCMGWENSPMDEGLWEEDHLN